MSSFLGGRGGAPTSVSGVGGAIVRHATRPLRMFVLVIGLVFAVAASCTVVMIVGISRSDPAAGADPCGVGAGDPAATAGAVSGPIGQWSAEQASNAVAIISAGTELGVSARAQAIAVMTAMGESSLTVVDYGDTAGPDSRGLFQQRANGSWGTYEDRMDPRTSSINFYRALLRVEGWEAMEPTMAAHRTQRNADPYHYEQWWNDAVDLMNALTSANRGSGVTDPSTSSGLPTSGAPTSGAPDASLELIGCSARSVAPGTVTLPVPAGYASADRGNWGNAGGRWARGHTGTDFSVPLGTPVYAAHAGIARTDNAQRSWAGPHFVKITTGPDSLATWYAHMSSLTVADGEQVEAGQQIGTVGSEGNSTGPHLHFEVHPENGRIYDDNVNPTQWLAENLGRDPTP